MVVMVIFPNLTPSHIGWNFQWNLHPESASSKYPIHTILFSYVNLYTFAIKINQILGKYTSPMDGMGLHISKQISLAGCPVRSGNL